MSAVVLVLVLVAVAGALAVVVRAALSSPAAEAPEVSASGPRGRYRATPRVRRLLKQAGADVWELKDDCCVVGFARAVMVSFPSGSQLELLWAPDGSVWEARPAVDPQRLWRVWKARPRILAAVKAAMEGVQWPGEHEHANENCEGGDQ